MALYQLVVVVTPLFNVDNERSPVVDSAMGKYGGSDLGAYYYYYY